MSTPAPTGALATQVGGAHYKSLAIQPVEYVHANNLGFMEGSVIKYVTRHREKNKAEDLKKAIHFLALLLKLEYGVDVTITNHELPLATLPDGEGRSPGV
jgi:hypothetical protein